MDKRDLANSDKAGDASAQAREGGNPLRVAFPRADSMEAPSPQATKRDVAQVTLSTIGDVSLAVDKALGRVPRPPRSTRWLPVLGFFLLIYLASCWEALYMLKAAPWMQVFLAPLFPVLVAGVAFWLRQRWKFRAGTWRFESKRLRDALESVGHEAINAVNAIRANLIAFRLANRQAMPPEHLEEIERASRRIEDAVGKLQEALEGEGSKQDGGVAHPATEIAEAARRHLSS